MAARVSAARRVRPTCGARRGRRPRGARRVSTRCGGATNGVSRVLCAGCARFYRESLKRQAPCAFRVGLRSSSTRTLSWSGRDRLS